MNEILIGNLHNVILEHQPLHISSKPSWANFSLRYHSVLFVLDNKSLFFSHSVVLSECFKGLRTVHVIYGMTTQCSIYIIPYIIRCWCKKNLNMLHFPSVRWMFVLHVTLMKETGLCSTCFPSVSHVAVGHILLFNFTLVFSVPYLTS